MAMTLESLSTGIINRAPRIVILGTEKIGKTSFACGTSFSEDGDLVATGLNKPVVISVKGEEGADSLSVAKFPTAESYSAVLDALRTLATSEHEFETVVIDSASALEPILWADVANDNNKSNIEEFGYGKGYILALDYWRRILEALDWLRTHKNMTTILIGHTRIKTIADPETEPFDAYIFDIHEKAANLIFRWADVILFANTKKKVKADSDRAIELEGGRRFLFTHKTPAHPGGGRGVYGQLPNEMPLDWMEFQDAVTSVMASQQTNNN